MQLLSAVVVLLCAGCGGERAEYAAEAATDMTLPVEQSTAARIAAEYVLALRDGRTEDALNLLAAGPRSDATHADVESKARALGDFHLGAVEPVEASSSRIVFRVELLDAPGSVLRDGVSASRTRWVEVVHGWRGWRVARVGESPIAAAAWWPVQVWTDVYILEAAFSVEVPNGWERRPAAWAWSPEGRADPVIGVRWNEDADAASLFPPGARIVRSTPVEAAAGAGTEFLLQLSSPPERPDRVGASEVLVVIRTADGGRQVGLFGSAAAEQDVAGVRSIVRRMASTLELDAASSLTARPR